jgi:phosphatidylcholine synthase
VSFYLYVLRLPEPVTIGVLVALALLTFVPSRYLYPTQKGGLNRITNGLGIVWAFFVAWIVWRLPADQTPDADSIRLTAQSLFFPAYYMVVSWIVSIQFALNSKK